MKFHEISTLPFGFHEIAPPEPFRNVNQTVFHYGGFRGGRDPNPGSNTTGGSGVDYMYSVSVSLVQQHPGVVGCCRSRVVVVEVELVVLPPIKPLGPIGPSSIVDHHGSLRDAREHPVHGRLHIVTGPHSAANSHSWQLKLSAAATLVAAL